MTDCERRRGTWNIVTILGALLLLSPFAAGADDEAVARWKSWRADLDYLYEEIEKPASLRQIFKVKGIDWKAVRKEADKRFKAHSTAAKKRRRADQEGDEVAFYGVLEYVVSQLRDSHAHVQADDAIANAWKEAQPRSFQAGIEFLPGTHGAIIVSNTFAGRGSNSPLYGKGVRHEATVIESINGEPAAEYFERKAREKYEEQGWQSTLDRAYIEALNDLSMTEDESLDLVFKTLEASEKERQRYLEQPPKKRAKAYERLKWDSKKTSLRPTECEQTRNPRNFIFMALERPELQETVDGGVRYGRLPSGYGYVTYRSVSGKSRAALDQACAALSDCAGLVLDMRLNGGGGESGIGAFDAREGSWDKPVAVLIGPKAMSAAETELWTLRDMCEQRSCNARFFGRTTAGASGDKIRFELPSSAGAMGELPGEATEVVALAERNTIRLISLINDILDLERLETGRMEMHLGPTSLQAVMERSVDSLGTVADARGVTLLTPSSLPEVVGDQDRLVQVLVNLLSNAVKFSPEGGTVTVGVSERPGWAELTVRDQGRGVPADHRQAIFERFRQVEASDARRERGAGLGLAICKAIINQHGGEIGVRQAEGGGSTFWFRIPTPSSPSVMTEPGGAEVLVCVPDSGTRKTLGEVLRRAGYRVRLVSRPDEAVAELRSRPPALVVVEATEGEGSGLELLDAIGLSRELPDVPVVVLGEHMVFPSDEPPRNVTFFLPRPPDENELLQAIRRGLVGRRTGDVILVDDDVALLDVMARQLTGEGVSVRKAATGREAVRLARESCPTLLVLDVGLPDLDGFDVVEALRGDEALEAIPLLVYTGRDLSGEQRRRLRLGPTRFVTKSKVTDDAFRDLVIELLRSPKAEESGAS